MNHEVFAGVGRTERRKMIRLWKESGSGLSLKEWARLQHPVGDAGYAWLQAKVHSTARQLRVHGTNRGPQ